MLQFWNFLRIWIDHTRKQYIIATRLTQLTCRLQIQILHLVGV